MQRKLVHPLILLGLAQVLLANEECDSSVGHCQGESHSTEEKENKYNEELNAMDDGAVEKENGDLEEKRDETKPNGAAEQQDTTYREMFDKDGLFNRDLAKEYLDKEDYEQVEETEGQQESPLYQVKLQSQYEEGITGVHLMNKYQQQYAMDEFVAGRLGPGEMGNGVILEKMSIDENLKKELMYLDHAFNQYLSDIISVNRSLPDRRDDWCKRPSSYYAPVDQLPKTSIIICFHNEAWSTLLRSIYSVLNRSPAHLVHEILLVDDASTMEHLKEDLDALVAQTPKLRLLRLPFRQGLVRTRMAGIRAAEADVLTFLDSHIEATYGWLEPLLDRVARNYMTVACPVIEAIDEKTMQYKFVSQDLVGTFNWKLEFDWSPITEEQQNAREHPWAPYNSPTMAGGLFSISKTWFEEIGLYDEGMEIWGGENIEMSFRQWMCGGSIEVVPCSRVGHIFRSWSPYPWRTDINVLTYNPLRVAEVWMDDYRFLYYDRYGRWDKPLSGRVGHFGDVSERRALRERLQCHSFQWYLDNVAVEMPQHQLLGSGEIFNLVTKQCLDQSDKVTDMGKAVKPLLCHMTGGNQYWMFRTDGKILRDFLCIGRQVREDKTEEVAVVPCDNSVTWSYDHESHLFTFKETGTCLTLRRLDNAQDEVGLAECDPDSELQQWYITHFNPGGMAYRDLA